MSELASTKWNRVVDGLVAGGMPRAKAIAHAAANAPNLHRQMLIEANSDRPKAVERLLR